MKQDIRNWAVAGGTSVAFPGERTATLRTLVDPQLGIVGLGTTHRPGYLIPE